ncbi:MAG: hypothetical protein CBD21_00140 [bacterium TMED161]|nr:MAG: hypothetical protein CBD21_00140 [bacterium TMED161]
MVRESIKVSLGIPVYNESRFLKKTIDSLINQTYSNIEIIAIDNASTDNSFRILKEYSNKDPRLKIFKNDKNIGLSNNFNLLVSKSSGEYFGWIGAHDIYNKDYIEKMVSKIIKNNNSSVVFSNVSKIDSDNKIIINKKETGFQLLNNNKFIRLLKIPWLIKGSGDIVMGIFEVDKLKKTDLFSKSVLWADVFLVYQLASTGKIIRINEVLRSRRYFREDEREFDSWELKYKTLTERFRGPREIGDSKPSIYLYFPVLFMCWKIFFEMGIKKIFNPLNLLISLYLISIFAFKKRNSLFIDIKSYFQKSS